MSYPYKQPTIQSQPLSRSINFQPPGQGVYTNQASQQSYRPTAQTMPPQPQNYNYNYATHQQSRQQPIPPPPYQGQQNVYEVHHVQRPLEVITIDEIEGPWRLKCATLERQILELQIQLRKGGMPQIETVEVVDDTKVRQLEKRLQELKQIAKERDLDIEQLKERIRDIQQQIEESGSSQVTYMTTEVETWKKKFTELNREYSEAQEQLTMIEAELDMAKRQGGGGGGQTVVTTTTSKSQKR